MILNSVLDFVIESIHEILVLIAWATSRQT